MPFLLVGIIVAAIGLSAITGLDSLGAKRRGPGGANVASFARGGGGGSGGPRAPRLGNILQNIGSAIGPLANAVPDAAASFAPSFASASVPVYTPAPEPTPGVPWTAAEPGPLDTSNVPGAQSGLAGDPYPTATPTTGLVKTLDGRWVTPEQIYAEAAAANAAKTAPAATPQSPSGYTPPPAPVVQAPPPATTLQSAATAGPVPSDAPPFDYTLGVQPVVGGGVTGHGGFYDPLTNDPIPAPAGGGGGSRLS